jgi:hypothetical protein
LSIFFLGDQTNDKTIALTGSTVRLSDNETMTITLTESQRVRAVKLSGTTGGDDSSIVLDVLAGALRDMATNLNNQLLNLQVIEYNDTIKPIITGAKIDLNDNAKLVFYFSETVDLLSQAKVDLNKLFLSNVTGEETVSLSASTITTEEYALSITVHLVESARVKAIENSNTPGGDNTGLLLFVKDGCLKKLLTVLSNINNATIFYK